jgi:hypothetical protein
MMLYLKMHLIKRYLDKTYYIKEGLYFHRVTNLQEWGHSISDTMRRVLSLNRSTCESGLYQWAMAQGSTCEQLDVADGPRRLSTSWNPTMAQDLQSMFRMEDAEKNVIKVLHNSLAQELESDALVELEDKLDTADKLLSFVKCLGFEPGQTVYNPNDFTPVKFFISCTYYDKMNERQVNDIWQDWVRTRKQNQEA